MESGVVKLGRARLRTAAWFLVLAVIQLPACGDAEPYQSRDRERASAEAALKKSLSRSVEQQPFGQALEQLSGEVGIAIEFVATDEPDLFDQTVELTLGEMSLESALSLLCQQADCDWYLDDGAIKVDTESAVSQRLETRTYPIADLLTVEPILDQPNHFTVGLGITYDFSAYSHPRDLANSPRRVADSIAVVLATHAEWAFSQPGAGEIVVREGMLVVNHDRKAHRQIERALDLMRRLNAPGAAVETVLTPAGSQPEARLLQALEERVVWRIPEQCSLSDIADTLRTRFGVNVVVVDAPKTHRADWLARWFVGLPDNTLKSVRLDDAIDMILRAYDCRMEIHAEALRIVPSDSYAYESTLRAYPATWLIDMLADGGRKTGATPLMRELLDALMNCADAVSVVPGGLIVSQPYAEARKTRDLMTLLRQAMDAGAIDYDPRPPSPHLRALDDKLNRIVDVAIDDQPLGQALADLLSAHEIDNVVFDWRGLDGSRLSVGNDIRKQWLATRVSLHLEGATLRSAINRLLETKDHMPEGRVVRGDNFLKIVSRTASVKGNEEWRVHRTGLIPGPRYLPLENSIHALTQPSAYGTVDWLTAFVASPNLLITLCGESQHQRIDQILDVTQALVDPQNQDQLVVTARRTPAEEKIFAAMESRADWTVTPETTLQNIVDELRRRFAINVAIDDRTFASISVDPTATLASRQRFGQSLAAYEFDHLTVGEIVSHLVRPFGATLAVADDTLMIVDADWMSWEPYTRDLRGYRGVNSDGSAEDLASRAFQSILFRRWFGDVAGELTNGEFAHGGALMLETFAGHRACLEAAQECVRVFEADAMFSLAPSDTLTANDIRELLNQLVDVEFDNVPLADALRRIRHDHGIPNILFWDTNPSGNVTLSLRGVRLETAIKLILAAADAGWHLARHEISALPYTLEPAEHAVVASLQASEQSVSPRVYRSEQLTSTDLKTVEDWDSLFWELYDSREFIEYTSVEIPGGLLVYHRLQELVELEERMSLAGEQVTQGRLLPTRPENTALWRALQTRVTFKSDDEPLADAFTNLARHAGIHNTYVARGAFSIIQQDPRETRVSLDVQDERLIDALHMLTAQPHGDAFDNCTWAVVDNCLVLTPWIEYGRTRYRRELREYSIPEQLQNEVESIVADVSSDSALDSPHELDALAGDAFVGSKLLIAGNWDAHRAMAIRLRELGVEMPIDETLLVLPPTEEEQRLAELLQQPADFVVEGVTLQEAIDQAISNFGLPAFFPEPLFWREQELTLDFQGEPLIDILRNLAARGNRKVDLIGERVWFYRDWERSPIQKWMINQGVSPGELAKFNVISGADRN